MRYLVKLVGVFMVCFSVTSHAIEGLERDAAFFFDESCVSYRFDYSTLTDMLEYIEAKKFDPAAVKGIIPINSMGGSVLAYIVKSQPLKKLIAYSDVACSVLIMKQKFDGSMVRDHFVSNYSLGEPKFKSERSFVTEELYIANAGVLKGYVFGFVSSTIAEDEGQAYSVFSLLSPEGRRLALD
jgi:hypothetical protein